MSEPLNLDPITVVSIRPLPSGDVEALLKVSKRDYERLLVDHSGMHYSIDGATRKMFTEKDLITWDPTTPAVSVRTQQIKVTDEEPSSSGYWVGVQQEAALRLSGEYPGR